MQNRCRRSITMSRDSPRAKHSIMAKDRLKMQDKGIQLGKEQPVRCVDIVESFERPKTISDECATGFDALSMPKDT